MKKDVPTYFRYWGKAEKDGSRYHLLPYHSSDVATNPQSITDQKGSR